MNLSKEQYEKYMLGLQRMEDAPCAVCEEGSLAVSTFTKTKESSGTTLIVKDIPALLCDACGDVTYTEAIAQRLDDLLEAAVANDRNTLVWTFRGSEVS